ALYSNTTGVRNTASGSQALYNNTTSHNTATGFRALYSNTTGSSNTANGDAALYSNTTGSNNIAVGDGAGYFLTGDYNIDIGHEGFGSESNTIRIGIQGAQLRTFIAGIFGVTTQFTAVPVLIDGAGQLGTISSSKRF